MTNNFITDNEIDKILGKMTEYKKEPERGKAPVLDRYNVSAEEKARLREEYSRKKAQEFASTYANGTHTNTMGSTYKGTTTNVSTFTSAGTSAGVVRRVYAFCTDLCLVGLAMIGFVYGTTYFFGTETFNTTSLYSSPHITWLFGGLYAVLFFFYATYFEGLIGQTPGKMFLNVRIVDSDNNKPSFSTTILRTILFLIPPLGLFGLHNAITKTKLVMND